MNQRELFLRHVAQTSDSPMMGEDIDIVSASGSTLVDVHGKKYIDLISGISVSSIGHCHPRVVAAVQKQSEKFMHLMVYGEFNQRPQTKYAELLCSQLPPSLNSVFFTTGGSEAVEGAMKLAKRATGRSGIVAFQNAYHGSTQGALSMVGDETLKNPFRPLIPGITILQFNDLNSLEEIKPDTAAVFVEPVQGEAGVRPASKEFLAALRKRCDKAGALLVFDEIQTGFGRTGSLFAFQQYDVVPDILLIAKAMGGGMPIGAFVADRLLMQALSNNPALGHINTFGGNAVAVAAAHATLEVIISDSLWKNAEDISEKINALKHPLIKQVRASGALAAIEFGSENTNMDIIRRCIKRGIITDWFLFCGNAMRVAPPLTIGAELDVAIKKIKEILDETGTR